MTASKITILIIDDDEASQVALRQILDTESWSVGVASAARQALPALAKGDWTLVVANLSTTGLSGPLFTTLKELALAPAMESGKGRLRVLFVVPQTHGVEAQRALESARLPYVLRPFNLHDFLEKVSDLLMESEAIPAPIRRVRQEGLVADRQTRQRQQSNRGRAEGPRMFAKREDYAMTEEEIAEYEKQEEEARRKKKKVPGA
jgi:DNA-binding NtrC family response regulator